MTNKKYIDEFDKEFGKVRENLGSNWHIGPGNREELRHFLIKTIDAVREEEQRYKGKLKREWYMRGHSDGREGALGNKCPGTCKFSNNTRCMDHRPL